MNLKKTIICILAIAFVFFSCVTSPDHYDEVDYFAEVDDFDSALAAVEQEKDSSYQLKNRVLYYLDSGLLAHYAQLDERSNHSLHNAEQAIAECYTKSISQSISSYIVNDNTQDYTGEDYEDIYVNVFSALNYCRMGKQEDALIEVRKVDSKLKFLAFKYDAFFEDSEKSFRDNSATDGFRRQPVNFSTSALAHYISMLLYRNEGKSDDVRIDRNAIAKAFTEQPELYPFNEPASIADEQKIPSDKARLNFICFTGQAPIKEEFITRYDDYHRDSHFKLAVPILVQRPSKVARIDIQFDDGTVIYAEKLEDMAAAAVETFKIKADLIYNKALVRALTKSIATSAVNAVSRKSDNRGLAALVSIGTKVFTEVSEQADTRCSRYFPGAASVTGITLNPGIYSFTITYRSKNGHILKQERFENVTVQEGALNLQESICLY